MLEEPRRVEKPWGYELIWAETDAYVGKILHVHAGEALSLQYHRVKEETLYLLRGRLSLEAGSSLDALVEYTMVSGDAFHVVPGVLHRMTAETDCDVLEASTPHLEDIVRLEDRYGRVPPDGPGGGPAGSGGMAPVS